MRKRIDELLQDAFADIGIDAEKLIGLALVCGMDKAGRAPERLAAALLAMRFTRSSSRMSARNCAAALAGAPPSRAEARVTTSR